MSGNGRNASRRLIAYEKLINCALLLLLLLRFLAMQDHIVLHTDRRSENPRRFQDCCIAVNCALAVAYAARRRLERRVASW